MERSSLLRDTDSLIKLKSYFLAERAKVAKQRRGRQIGREDGGPFLGASESNPVSIAWVQTEDSSSPLLHAGE